MLAGLLTDIRNRPENNAVDAFALAYKWKPLPPESLSMLNAKRGYAGRLAGQAVMLGSDGTNEVIAITYGKDFQPEEIRRHFDGIINLSSAGTDAAMGQRTDLYRAKDSSSGSSLGMISLTYGTAEQVKGFGTIAYFSAAAMEKNGIR